MIAVAFRRRGRQGPARFALVALAALVSLASGLSARAQPASTAVWHEPWTARVDVQFPGLDFHARYDFWRCACGDVLIRAEETEPAGVTRGELLLIRGKTLLVRGFGQPPGNLEHLLDSPMLMVQLVFTLLHRAAPGGPATVSGERELSVTEAARPLTLDTGLATGRFGVPWRIEGRARPVAGTPSTLRYELSFRFENEQDGVSLGQAELRFSGSLGFGGEAFPYGGDLPMTGWKRQRVVYDGDAPAAVPAEGTLADERARASGRPAP